MSTHEQILQVENLKKYFSQSGGLFSRSTGTVRAVDDISFEIRRGETFGLVGESGCGKSTTARLILRAIEPTAGRILLTTKDGRQHDVTAAEKQKLRRLRDEMHMVFQDPYASLNPRMTVQELVAEPLIARGWRKADYSRRVEELLELVGLNRQHLNRYPHAFSGGQRQRIGIARSLALNPALIVADEAVSALDVSVQAQIINLMEDLQAELGITYLFIAHDLSVVQHICSRVAVMYLGRIVELGTTHDVFSAPRHPYTELLLSAVPVANPHVRSLTATGSGDISQSRAVAGGCPFAPRCPYAEERCREAIPSLARVGGTDDDPHSASCYRSDELELKGIR
jgi:peptide/nickel transport system ATP-binding protein